MRKSRSLRIVLQNFNKIISATSLRSTTSLSVCPSSITSLLGRTLSNNNNNNVCPKDSSSSWVMQKKEYHSNRFILNSSVSSSEKGADYLTSKSISLGVDESGIPLSQSFLKPTISYEEFISKCRAMELGEVQATTENVNDLYLYVKYDRISGLSHCSREQIEGLYKYAFLNCYRFESSFDRSLCAQGLYDKLMEILFQRELKEFDLSLLEGKNKVHLKPEDVIPVTFNDTDLYVILIDIYSENNFPEQTFELFESMKKHFHILHKQEEILQGLASAMDDDGADTVIHENSSSQRSDTSRESEEIEDSSEIIIDPDHVDEVLKIELEHIYEDPVEELASSSQKPVENPSHISVLDDPNDTDVLVPNFPRLNSRAFNQLIDACAGIGRIKDVYQILQFMISNNIEMTTDTLNKAIKACIPSGSSYEALRLFDMIRENSGLTVKPDIETCKLLLRTCYEARDEHSYKDIYEGMKRMIINNETGVTEGQYESELLMDYLTCKCATATNDNCSECLKLLEDFEAKTGGKLSIDFYNQVLQACARVGDKKTALKILEKTLREYTASQEDTSQDKNTYTLPNMDTFNGALKTLSYDGDLRTGDLYKHLRKLCKDIFKPNTETFNAIIAAEINRGDIMKAKKILREMRARGLIPNTTTFNQLFYGYYKTDWEHHMKEFREKERASIFKAYYEKWEKEQAKLHSMHDEQQPTLSNSDDAQRAIEELLFTSSELKFDNPDEEHSNK
ncbi:hypothetical protein FDP41_007463 [Naegleria fowleri]|uniref:Pentacotripeptide-repeat region of PRORP domain-containing protein n=1 Tax=Naegleria fowleri TaxID=5763 RepID=A0A6A5C947_NAEFO|nr:uncharacterized protein FDP41_007463 [Naegleria fowleri]KAF0984286.1 hypothetical protein FDP41_007463 [Naegleria fowleri]CAG4707702.1 unnamed protein product [Naegleria fowleri]